MRANDSERPMRTCIGTVRLSDIHPVDYSFVFKPICLNISVRP